MSEYYFWVKYYKGKGRIFSWLTCIFTFFCLLKVEILRSLYMYVVKYICLNSFEKQTQKGRSHPLVHCSDVHSSVGSVGARARSQRLQLSLEDGRNPQTWAISATSWSLCWHRAGVRCLSWESNLGIVMWETRGWTTAPLLATLAWNCLL